MQQGLDGTPEPAEEGLEGAELRLVRRVLENDVAAWHTFVERYRALIESVIRRYGPQDFDDARTVFVGVLEHLRYGALQRFSAQSRLSTWLGYVTRNFCVDDVRRRQGRRDRAERLARLTTLERRVYALYFVEGLPFSVVREQIGGVREGVTILALANAIAQVRERLSDEHLDRLAYDCAAREIGVASGRRLRILSMYQHELETPPDPETILSMKAEQALLDRVRALVDELPEDERSVISARFGRGLTAREIADSHGYSAARRVYTVMDRGLRRLRRWIRAGRGRRSAASHTPLAPFRAARGRTRSSIDRGFRTGP